MLDTKKWHSTNYGAGWAYDNVPDGTSRRRARGFTYRNSPKRFLFLSTIFVIAVAYFIATVGFGIEF